MDVGASCPSSHSSAFICVSDMPCPSRTEGMLGTREVKTGVVFYKDPNLREDVHWGPGSGEERRAPTSAV